MAQRTTQVAGETFYRGAAHGPRITQVAAETFYAGNSAARVRTTQVAAETFYSRAPAAIASYAGRSTLRPIQLPTADLLSYVG